MSTSNEDPRELTAQAFAEQRHAAQKYGDQPYVVHLAQVRAVLTRFDHSGVLGIAAWLHDSVEDTGTTREEVRTRFGEEVEALVWAVTGQGSNRQARNADAYAKIRAHSAAATLKLADRIANVEASLSVPDKLSMYASEYSGFKEALAGLGDARMWAHLDTLLTRRPH